MSQAQWTGLALGVAIGAICGFWHAWDMRGGTDAALGLPRVISAAGRLAFLLLALLAAVAVAGAEKVWLVASVAVVYTSVFVWKFRRALAKKK